jgi:type IV pilus assembly protein PilC
MGDPMAQEGIERVRHRVREGSPLHRAVAEIKIFPPELWQLIALGEESGRLADFLLKGADFLERRTERALERMVSLVGPVMIVMFGGIVALVALSLLQAIYGINPGSL